MAPFRSLNPTNFKAEIQVKASRQMSILGLKISGMNVDSSDSEAESERPDPSSCQLQESGEFRGSQHKIN